ncbi:MAG: hypothetical protein WCI22_03765 [Actinomycetota bacterium]
MATDALLAYDPPRVALLFRSLCRMVDVLRGVRCELVGNAQADAAVLSVRRAIDDIDTVWIPLAQRVLREQPMEPRVLVGDVATLTSLADDLQTLATDPFRCRQFLASYGNWSELTAELAGRRRLLLTTPDGDHLAVRRVDAAIEAMGAVVGSAVGGTCSSAAVLGALRNVSPYAAAIMLPAMHLDGVTLSDVVVTLLQQWLDQPHLLHVEGPHDDADPVDTLLAALVDDPVACTHFVASAAQHPDVLFVPGHDPALAQRVVLIGTDPAHVAPSTAGDLVLPVISVVAGAADLDPAAWRSFLVDLVVPWTVQFSPRNTDWSADARTRSELLGFVLSEASALERLLRSSNRVLANIGDWVQREHPSSEDLATYIGSLGQLVVNDRMNDERGIRAGRELLWSAISLVVGAMPLTLAATAATVAVVWVMKDVTTPDTEVTRKQANFGEDLAVTAMASSVALRLTQEWERTGVLSRTFPLPPKADPHSPYPSLQFIRDFGKWRDSLPGGYYGHLADRMTREVYTVLSPSQAGEHLVR